MACGTFMPNNIIPVQRNRIVTQVVKVRDTFKSLINDNNKAVGKLRESIRDIQGKRDATEKTYDTMIDRFAGSLFWPSLDDENLGKLSASLGNSIDFVQTFKDAMTASREAEIRLNALTATHGEESKLEEKVRSIQQQVNKAEEKEEKLETAIRTATRALSPVDEFNAGAKEGAPKLNEADIGYFSSKSGFAHVWSWMVNSHYREGRAVIKEMTQGGNDIVALQKNLAADTAALPDAKVVTQALIAERKEVEKPLAEIRETASGVFTEQQIADGMKLQVAGLLADRDFFNKLASEMGPAFPSAAVELRAKLEGFDKLEDGANKAIKGLESASKNLDKHMYKLDKAARNKPSHDVKIDLDKIKKGYNAQAVLATHKAGEIKKASTSIDTYSGPSSPTYVGYSPLDFYMGFMIADMLNHSHHDHGHAVAAAADAGTSVSEAASSAALVDPAVINDTLGIPDNIATDMNLDLDNLAPALSDADLSSLGDSFNGAAGLDLGNVDVGSFDVPDISIPDISIDVGSIDVGGGFDFGGGIDF